MYSRSLRIGVNGKRNFREDENETRVVEMSRVEQRYDTSI